MSSQAYSEQIKLFTDSEVIAKVVQEKIAASFPRLTVEITEEAPKENSKLTKAVIITGLYNACVEPLTDFVVPLAMQINAVLYVLFDKDPARNMNDCYDWSQDS
jgi:hypothetical protein